MRKAYYEVAQAGFGAKEECFVTIAGLNAL